MTANKPKYSKIDEITKELYLPHPSLEKEKKLKEAEKWLGAFKQTYTECMSIIREEEPRNVTPAGMQNSYEEKSTVETQGAGCAVKGALLIVEPLKQDDFLEKIGAWLEKAGFSAIEVFRQAREDAASLIGKFTNSMYQWVRTKGVPAETKRKFRARAALCTVAMAGMVFASSPALAVFNPKIQSDGTNGTAFFQSVEEFNEINELIETNLVKGAVEEARVELALQTDAMLLKFIKNRPVNKNALGEYERNELARPLTMMLALSGRENQAIALQLVATPESDRLYDYLERKNINPFELVDGLLRLTDKNLEEARILRTVRCMYGQEDVSQIISNVMEKMERKLNTELYGQKEKERAR